MTSDAIVTLGFMAFCAFVIFSMSGGRLKKRKVLVLYGYPKNKKIWLSVYYHRSKDKWIFEWDDLFDSGRPRSWGDASKCLMFNEKNSGATEEEIIKAWSLLQKRGLA